MIGTDSFSDRVRRVFQPSERGVVGLVDDLLQLCRDDQLRLDYQGGHCEIRSLSTPSRAVPVPVPVSVFRAALARVAALCNERHPNSVTPYRGQGELTSPADPDAAFFVAFTNTPAEQQLEVRLMSRPGLSVNGAGVFREDVAGTA